MSPLFVPFHEAHPYNEVFGPDCRVNGYRHKGAPMDHENRMTPRAISHRISTFCVHSLCEWVRGKSNSKKAIGFEMGLGGGCKLHQGDAGPVKRTSRKKEEGEKKTFQHNSGHCCYLCCWSCFYNWFAPPAQWPGNHENPVVPVLLCCTLMRSPAQGGPRVTCRSVHIGDVQKAGGRRIGSGCFASFGYRASLIYSNVFMIYSWLK